MDLDLALFFIFHLCGSSWIETWDCESSKYDVVISSSDGNEYAVSTLSETFSSLWDVMQALGSTSDPSRTTKTSILFLGVARTSQTENQSRSCQIRIPSYTVFNSCGEIHFDCLTENNYGYGIVLNRVHNVDIPNLRIFGTASIGVYTKLASNIRFGRIHIELSPSSGLGIRIESTLDVELQYLYATTGGHGLETMNTERLVVGYVRANRTGDCGVILNTSKNVTIGTVDAYGTAWNNNGYAALRFANSNGKFDNLPEKWPQNIHVGNLTVRDGKGRGFFCVSNSGGATIEYADIDRSLNLMLIQNCYNLNIGSYNAPRSNIVTTELVLASDSGLNYDEARGLEPGTTFLENTYGIHFRNVEISYFNVDIEEPFVAVARMKNCDRRDDCPTRGDYGTCINTITLPIEHHCEYGGGDWTTPSMEPISQNAFSWSILHADTRFGGGDTCGHVEFGDNARGTCETSDRTFVLCGGSTDSCTNSNVYSRQDCADLVATVLETACDSIFHIGYDEDSSGSIIIRYCNCHIVGKGFVTVADVENDLFELIPTTSSPTTDPTAEPTQTTLSPTAAPSLAPTSSPSHIPSMNPSMEPTSHPSGFPSNNPSLDPTSSPSNSPTKNPTLSPSANPTMAPTSDPSISPTENPTQVDATNSPSMNPSKDPSGAPSTQPTLAPTSDPSILPTGNPTLVDATNSPTCEPSSTPSGSPTSSPSFAPSMEPTSAPSANPTEESVTLAPTSNPSTHPSLNPTFMPTGEPTMNPSSSPSMHPSINPSGQPTGEPTPPIETATLSLHGNYEDVVHNKTLFLIECSTTLSCTCTDVQPGSIIVTVEGTTEQIQAAQTSAESGVDLESFDILVLLSNVPTAAPTDPNTDASTATSGGDDDDNMMLYIIIAAGAVVVLGACAFFLYRSGGSSGKKLVPEDGNLIELQGTPKRTPQNVPSKRRDSDEVPVPNDLERHTSSRPPEGFTGDTGGGAIKDDEDEIEVFGTPAEQMF